MYAARDGAYADALRKHIRLVLLVCESTGAVNRACVTLLRSLERATRRKRSPVQDGTQYGTTPASVDSFTRYHLAAIAIAITRADAVTVATAAGRCEARA